jgi:hypothetical protein
MAVERGREKVANSGELASGDDDLPAQQFLFWRQMQSSARM